MDSVNKLNNQNPKQVVRYALIILCQNIGSHCSMVHRGMQQT
jgi:hypothetical protein